MALETLKSIHKKTSTLLWLLNVSDLLFTLFFIGNKWATEGNPFLLYLFNKSVWAFVIAKMLVSTSGVLFLSRFPNHGSAVIGTAFLSGVYFSLFVFQLTMTVQGLL